MNLPEEYIRNLKQWGLYKLKASPEITKYLNMTSEEIESLDFKKIDDILIILGQHRIYLQTELNKWNVQAKILKRRYEKLLNTEITKNKEKVTLTEKKANALANNKFLQRLFNSYNEAVNYTELLHNIPDVIGDQIINFRRIKQARESQYVNPGG